MTTDQQPENPDGPQGPDGTVNPDGTVDREDLAPGDDAERQRTAEAFRQASGVPEAADGTADADPIDAALQQLLDEQAGDAADDRSPQQLREELDEATRQLAEATDDNLRLRAEFANFRKRTERDALQGRRSGQADVLIALLDVLDDFDRTIAAAAESPDDGLRSGVAMVRDKFAAALANQGLVRVDEAGVPFDPNHHEAIQKVEADDGPLDHERVQQVYRPGYLHGDRVLRAAMVVVEQ